MAIGDNNEKNHHLDEDSEEDEEESYEAPKTHFAACNSITFKPLVSDVSMVRPKRKFPRSKKGSRAVASE